MSRLTFRGLLSSLPVISSVVVPRPGTAASPVERVEGFDLARVRVTDPHHQHRFTIAVRHLLRLDPEQFLAGFRSVSSGQHPSNAAGRSLPRGERSLFSIRGHALGQYLTALAQAYRQTLDAEPALNLEIADDLGHAIDELKTCQDRSANGYLFASPETHFDVVEGRVIGEEWAPWSAMHELIAGIVDVYELTGNPTALDVASRLGEWVFERTVRWDDAIRSRVLGVEHGGMNACLYDLYQHTGDPNHLTAAHRFDEDDFFSLLSQGTANPTREPAHTQIPRLLGALNRYRVLGEPESCFLLAAERLWSMVVEAQSCATGGNRENELFRAAGQLDATRHEINDEARYPHDLLELTRELFRVTGEVKYADYYERVLINEILSPSHPETAMAACFEPMGTAYAKLFGKETDPFWCCNGTGMQNYTQLSGGIFFHDATHLYVNLYVSSTLDWPERSLALTQTADVPLSSTVVFTIDAAPADELGIKLRRPSWLAAGALATLTVNGEVAIVQEQDGYLEVSRVWSVGDRMELTLPADVRAWRRPDNPNAVAFTYGPVVLSAGLGTEPRVSTGHLASERATLPAGVTVKDTIVIDGRTTIEDWLANLRDNLVQTPGQLEFTLRNTDEDGHLRFTPRYLRYQDRYGVYFRLQGRQGTRVETGGAAGETWTDGEASTGGRGGGASGTGGAGASSGGVTVAGGGGAVFATGGTGASTGGTVAAGGSTVSAGGRVDSTSLFGATLLGLLGIGRRRRARPRGVTTA